MNEISSYFINYMGITYYIAGTHATWDSRPAQARQPGPSRSFIHSSASVILLLIPSSVLFICLFLVLIGLGSTFLASSQCLPPFFSWDPGSSSLSLFWILSLECCLSPLHISVFLGFYLVPSSGTYLSAFSAWLTFCNMVFVLAAVGLCFFCLPSDWWG